ncbi:unnamed protein product [Closterium sp. NIES-53]
MCDPYAPCSRRLHARTCPAHAPRTHAARALRALDPHASCSARTLPAWPALCPARATRALCRPDRAPAAQRAARRQPVPGLRPARAHPTRTHAHPTCALLVRAAAAVTYATATAACAAAPTKRCYCSTRYCSCALPCRAPTRQRRCCCATAAKRATAA